MLQEAINNALSGQGSFRLFSQNELCPPLKRSHVDGPSRGAVMWPMKNTPEAIWLLLAAMQKGIVPLLLPDGLPAAKMASLRARFPNFGVLANDIIEWPSQPAILDRNLFIGLLTSGSTGEPKAIVTSASRLTRGIRAIHSAQELDDVASTAVLLPIAYSYACVNQLLWSVLAQRDLYLTGALTNMAQCMEAIRQSCIEMLCLVAHQVPTLLRLGSGLAPLSCVRRVNFAGSPFPVGSLQGLQRLFPSARFMNNYGCAEAMPRLTCTEVVSTAESLTFVGKPIGDIELRIVSGGAIEFQGSSTALGTLSSDGSLNPFEPWIASGDLGQLKNSGLEVFGRHDQIIKVGGERVSLLDVEHALSVFGARHVAVWLAPGEQIVAVIEHAGLVDLKHLLKFLKDSLPRALLPSKIFVAEHWPLNSNQKTDRMRLQTQAREGVLTPLWPIRPD